MEGDSILRQQTHVCKGVQDKHLALSLWSFRVIGRHSRHRRRVKVTRLHWLECDDRVEPSYSNSSDSCKTQSAQKKAAGQNAD